MSKLTELTLADRCPSLRFPSLSAAKDRAARWIENLWKSWVSHAERPDRHVPYC